MLVHDLKSFLKVDERIAYKHSGIITKAHTQSREHHTGKAVTTILLLTVFQPWVPHQPLVLEASATNIFWKLVQQIRRKMVVNEVVLLMVGHIMLVVEFGSVHYNRTRHLESCMLRRRRFTGTKYVILCSALK